MASCAVLRYRPDMPGIVSARTSCWSTRCTRPNPNRPVSPSPYLPMARHEISPLYLRLEDIGEYQGLNAADRVRVETLAAPLRAASTTTALIDRDIRRQARRARDDPYSAADLEPPRRA